MPESKPLVNVVVEDKYTKKVEGLFSLEEPLVLRFSGPKRNLVNRVDLIERTAGKLHSIALDLYNIALVVYVCDTQIIRSALEPRDIRILMSVSAKDKWNSVKQHLEATLRFLTTDNFTFYFVQAEPAASEFRFEEKDARCISLFLEG